MNGQTLRDEGIALVEENTDDAWNDEVDSVIETLANSRDSFTSDDVWANVSFLPHHNSSMGAAFNRAAKSGLIKKVGWVESRRPSAHARVVRVWSLA